MFASIFENLDLVNIYKKNDFGEKFWISRFLIKIVENVNFGQHFRKN